MSATTNLTTVQPTPESHASGHPITSQPLDAAVAWFSTLESRAVQQKQQQQQSAQAAQKPRNWSTGLCDCTDDKKICCAGFWCLPCLACQVSQDMGESFCLPFCVPCAYIYVLRLKMRMEQNLLGSTMDDCCPVCCCPSCALCQLAREIKHVRRSHLTLTGWRRMDTSFS